MGGVGEGVVGGVTEGGLSVGARGGLSAGARVGMNVGVNPNPNRGRERERCRGAPLSTATVMIESTTITGDERRGGRLIGGPDGGVDGGHN